MARIRSVHPRLFTDEAWVSCSPLARLLVIGLWTDADDQGVFEWKPLQIKMRLLPGDSADAGTLLDEIRSAGLIADFELAGRRFGVIRNFRKYQRPKKPVAVHVLPDEWRDFIGIDDDDDPADNLRRELYDEQGGRCFYCESEITHYSKRGNSLDVDHRVPLSRGGTDDRENLVAACRACNRGKSDRSESEWRAILASRGAKPSFANAKPELGSQMEDGGGKGREEAIASSVAEDDFEAVWKAYPHVKGRSSKPKALAAWLALEPIHRIGLLAATRRYATEGKIGDFGAPAMGKWLDEHRFLDWRSVIVVPGAWSGPKEVRDLIVSRRDEAYAKSWLDPCGWQDVPERMILAHTSAAATKLWQDFGPFLTEMEISIGKRAA